MLFPDVERRFLLCLKLRVPKEVATKAKEGLIKCRKVGNGWLRNISKVLKRSMQFPFLSSNLKTCSTRPVTCSNIFSCETVIRYCIRREC